ncbi:MAG: MHS family MFS transporter [Proteobacteria bacterium]|nr:MHS family MFS transporter [Pseudomonadota bacterium]
MTSTAALGSSAPATKNMGIIAFAGTFGTIIEWYDFLIYGTAAALVFNKLFFPTVDPLTGTLASLATYAVGFVARPVGGALFGHFGDRIGRKSMLMLTMAVMGAGTFLVGLLPTYSQIGILAPVLLVLLRFVQGLAMGGEWGGASLMVLEHAPPGRRGFYGSLVQVGFSLGLVTSSGVFALSTSMPEASFLAWGWRLPFLVSIVLVLLGAFIRARVPETPVFEDMKARNDISANPFVEAVFKNPRAFLIALGLKLSEVSWVYMLTVFVVGYATSKLSLPRKLLLDAIFWAALVEVVTIPLFGWLSDKIGRRPFYFLGVLFTILFAFPLFWMLDTRDPTTVVLAIIIGLNLGHGLMFAPESAYFPELFGARVRFTGASFGFQASAAIGGGFAPIIATWLAAYMGGTVGVSAMLILLAGITLVATFFAHETKDVSLLK